MSTNYIFLHFSRHTNILVHGILSVLAGGFVDSNHKLCLVFVGGCDEALNKCVKNYIEVREQLISKCKKMYRQKLQFLILDNGDCSLSEKDNPLWENYITNNDVWNICNHMSLFDIHTLEKGDMITIVSSVDDVPTLTMYSYAVAMTESLSFDIPVRHVCECGNEVTEELCKSLIDNFVDVPKTTVVGLREDSDKTGITTMQVIETVLDVSVDRAGHIITAATDNLNYTHLNIGSRVAESLCRMELLYRMLFDLKNSNSDICQWMNRMELPQNFDFSTCFPMFGSTLLIYESFSRAMFDNRFLVDRQQIGEDMFVKELISSKSKLKGLTNEEKCWMRFDNVVSVLERMDFSYLCGESKTVDYISYGGVSAELYNLNIKSPSPTFLWELTKLSFYTSAMTLSEARIVRSYCLDFWEIFYRYEKEGLAESKIHVRECLLSKSNTKISFAFSLTKIGKRLCEEMYLYVVGGHEGKTFACTSPETGFAVMKNNIIKMNIRGKEFFDSSCPHELKDRESDFQIFLYNYVRCIGDFSKEFTNYVSQQLNESVRHEQDSKGLNIFKIYSDLGHHVGLELVNKKRI